MTRPKDVLREYIKDRHPDPDISHLLFDFVFWMEGQDREGMECRYHVVPADQSECPFTPPEEGE